MHDYDSLDKLQKSSHPLRAKQHIFSVLLYSASGQDATIDTRLGKEGVQGMPSVKLASSDFSIPEQRVGNSGIFENEGCF